MPLRHPLYIRVLTRNLKCSLFYLDIWPTCRPLRYQLGLPSLQEGGTRMGERETNAIRPLSVKVRSEGHHAARPTPVVPVLALLARRDPNRS